jgi:GDSL-like Lipase/Acylhydrolase family
MNRPISLLVFALFVAQASAQPAKYADRAEKWEAEIAALEKQQAEKPPAKGGVVFAGSSTIKRWDVNKALPEMKPTNSGFGGSEIRDVTMFAERIILKHEPRAIVFYAGNNDINSGRTADQVIEDFRVFTETVHKQLPKTRIYFISTNPSLARWKQFETQTQANAKVKALCAKDERLTYIDVAPKLLGDDGKPKAELFVKDGLHLSAEGYAILNDAVRKAMK